ncbi:MAG TPA: hypothetical protein VFL98_01085 [Candidatus Paceibacterota bacterium]|nr:hypothetical protein [Candidatus Paceibacterota bacterium]
MAQERERNADAARRENRDDRNEQRPQGRDEGMKGDQRGRRTEQGADLKAREYRDADGTIHHHTKVYMQQHGSGR